ncbi:MFS transporter [Thermodesulfobacteriota bacterium]
MKSSNVRNLQIFTAVSSIWSIVFGLIGPFYVVQVERLSGGMEKLGFAFAIMVLLHSLTSYCAGRFSDRLGRKPFLFLTSYAAAGTLILYTVIDSTYELYILQGVLGVTNGVAETISTSLLGDFTRREERGHAVGKFNAIVSLSSAAGLFLGGYVAKSFGLESLFYCAAVVVTLSTGLLFFIKEEEP